MSGAIKLIDASAHPTMRRSDDIRDYMPQPFVHYQIPNPDRYFYPAPKSDYLDIAWGQEGTAPGSDPTRTADYLFGDLGVDIAILVPLTRGLLPDVDLSSAICRATNDWLADIWLGSTNKDHRFKGSIRVNPRDPVEAVREIARWKQHPDIVQVAVPLESHQPYGKREFFSIWEAAAEADWPVAVHSDGGTGIELFPSPVGYFHHYIEYASFLPYNGFYHLTSFIAEGVFERLPNLRVVFGDGMGDIVNPLIWRMDSMWHAIRDRTPWVQLSPTEYLLRSVRFCARADEGPTSADQIRPYWAVNHVRDLQMYASNYPFSPLLQASEATNRIDKADAGQFLSGNARRLYKLGPGPA